MSEIDVINDYQNIVKRLQQECTEKTNAIIALGERLQAKEQGCEELKEILKVWKYSDVQHIFKINKYEQTLTEIKYIAEENIRIADLEGLSGVYRRGLAEQILQKISEVENET